MGPTANQNRKNEIAKEKKGKRKVELETQKLSFVLKTIHSTENVAISFVWQ